MPSFRHRQRKLTAAAQYFGLANNPICRGSGSVRRGNLRWEFDARPTPLSRVYGIRIEYREQKGIPRVYVVDPDLSDLAKGRNLPHVYAEKPARPCVYLPGTGEWSPELRIVDTIVPWTYLWLFYFEEWLVSDKWKGGGIHPSVEEKHIWTERNEHEG